MLVFGMCSYHVHSLLTQFFILIINHAGKTTTATLVARESGRDVLELNASDARSKKALSNALGDVTGSQVLSFDNMGDKKNKKKAVIQKRCIIMDEVDGMGAGDRSGMSELIQMIKKSKVPIVSRHMVSMCVLLAVDCLILTRVYLPISIHNLRFASVTTAHLKR